MKNQTRTLLALLCVCMCLVAAVFTLASCSEPECIHPKDSVVEVGQDQEPVGPIPGSTKGFQCTVCEKYLVEPTEYYLVQYKYSYTVTEKNANGRPTTKTEEAVVGSFTVDSKSNTLTAEQQALIKDATFHSFGFKNFYTGYDSKTGTFSNPFDFSAPITANTTIYLDRADLAGKNATWELVEAEGSTATKKLYELKITGTGDMFDAESFSAVDIPWFDQINNIVKFSASEGITSVGAFAVHAYDTTSNQSTSSLETLELPSTIKRIGNSAFVGAKFKNFTAPSGLEVIGTDAFKATRLTSLVLNEGLTTIESAAFFMSAQIKYVVVPTTLKSVGGAAFYPGASGSNAASHALSRIYYLGKNIEDFYKIDVAMDNMWFNETPVIYCYCEDAAVGETGGYWRYADAAKTIPLQYTFAIRYFLPAGSKLPIAIDYVKINTQDANNDGLPDTNADGDVIMSAKITAENVKFQQDFRYHGYKFDFASNSSTVLKEGTEITVDKSITCPRGKILCDDGNITWAFSGGTITVSLKSTTGTKKMWDFETITDTNYLWTGSSGTLESVTKIVIADGIEYIGKYTFTTMINVTEIYIPESVKEIHPTAFDGCTNLANIYYMGKNIADCKNIDKLENLKYMAFGKTDAATAADGDYWLKINNKNIGWSLHDGKLIIAGDAIMMDFTAPKDAPWYGAKDKITSVSIARNITSIGANIANAYTKCVEIKLHDKLTKIPASAFEGTGLLNNNANYKQGMILIDGNLLKVSRIDYMSKTLFETNVNIKNIAGGAFKDTAVTDVFLTKSVAYIDATAFAGSNVKNIYVEGKPATWKTIAKDFGTPAGFNIYFYSATKPTDTANKYFYKDDKGAYKVW